MGDPVLAIDVGTSGLRAACVDRRGRVRSERRREAPLSSPAPGRVEFDARALADATLELARAVLEQEGPVLAVGIANQRASTIVWDRASGEPIAPGQGWQDLRTAARCATLRERGIALLPNQSAPKIADILDQLDPDRQRDLCFGTVDSWLLWRLTEGAVHATDASNAAASGCFEAGRPNLRVLEALRIPARMLPRVVDSCGALGIARALPGQPPVAGMLGDQQASLLGQGCTRPGQTKITFGTGAMLDMMLGETPPSPPGLGRHGTYPVVACRQNGRSAYALEANALAAGASVDWLCDGLGLLSEPAASAAVAASCASSGGVVFVPSLHGLGTPDWDLEARGLFLGLTRGTDRAQLVRAVLEGVAQRGADLVEAAEADAGRSLACLRIDGGMSANHPFVQLLADATGRPVEVSPVREATTLGAARLAGCGAGLWGDLHEASAGWATARVVAPRGRLDRARWREARRRARSAERPS